MQTIKKLLYIALGTFLMAFGTVAFAEKAGVVAGGVSGIAVAVEGLFLRFGIHVPLYLTTMIINIPLFITAFIKRGGKFLYMSFYATVLFTVFLGICQYIPVLPGLAGDVFASSVLTGLFLGTGLILVVNNGASTGGTEMLALIVQDDFPKIKIPVMINIIDSIVILFGFFVFGLRLAFYGILAVFVTTFILSKKLKD